MMRAVACACLAAIAVACAGPNGTPASRPAVNSGVALNTSLPPIDVRYGIGVNDIELGILLAVAHTRSAPALRPGQTITDALLPKIVGAAKPTASRGNAWFFDGRRPGLIFAGYRQNQVRMRVAIRFDKQMVMLRIVESENLGQTEDRIDARALDLLAKLDRRIRNNVIAVAQRNRYGTPLPANQAY